MNGYKVITFSVLLASSIIFWVARMIAAAMMSREVGTTYESATKSIGLATPAISIALLILALIVLVLAIGDSGKSNN